MNTHTPGLGPRTSGAPPTASTTVNPLFLALVRRWRYLALCGVSALVLGYLTAKPLVTTTLTCQGTILYHPNQSGAPYYQPPDVQTIAGLLKSPGLLEQVGRTFTPSRPPAAIAAALRIEVPFGSQSIQVRLEGPTFPECRETLNRVMTTFVAEVGRVQQAARKHVAEDLHAAAARSRATVEAAQLALRTFEEQHRVVDLTRDIARLQDEIVAWERALTEPRERPLTVDRTHDQRAVLREQLQDERDQIAARAQIELKRSELERARALYERRYLSAAEYQRLVTELRALEEQESGRIERDREQLRRMNEAALARAQGETVPDDEPRLAVERQQREKLLAERRAELARLVALRPQYTERVEALETAQDQRQRAESLALTFDSLCEAKSSDLSIVQEATLSLDPLRSTTKKLLAMFSVGWFLVLAAPMLLWELFVDTRSPADRVALRFGWPSLCAAPRRRRSSAPVVWPVEDVRRLALRSQQSMPQSPRVVLWTSVTRAPLEASLAYAVGQCLAQRGERVALVDVEGPDAHATFWGSILVEGPTQAPLSAPPRGMSTEVETTDMPVAHGDLLLATRVERRVEAAPVVAPAEPHVRGMTDFLALPWLQLGDVMRATQTPGVDVLRYGSGPMPIEGLAMRRTSECFTQLRQHYTFVIVLGPRIESVVDVQLLAARIDGVVRSALSGKSVSSAGGSRLKELQALAAPIVGYLG